MNAAILSLVLAWAGETAALPDDARLADVRPRLETLVKKTGEAGLPADLLVSKVREGLAKGVDPARIEAAAGRLAESLQAARAFVVERRGGAPAPELVRALALAKMTGLDLQAADAVVRGQAAEPQAARAVDVLADLSRRGYPADRASGVVKDVLLRDPAALERVPAALETLRKEQALSQAEAVDALSRGISGSNNFQAAYTRTMDDERRKGPAAKGAARGNGQGAGSAAAAGANVGPGKSDLAPGHMMKSMKMPGNSGMHGNGNGNGKK